MRKNNYTVSIETQQDILKSATKIFAQDGYKGASIEAIAKDCLQNKSLVYYHFTNKEGLYNEIFANTLLQLQDELKTQNILQNAQKLKFIASYLRDKKTFSLLMMMELGANMKNLNPQTKEMLRDMLSFLLEDSSNPIGSLGVLGALHFLNLSADSFRELGVVRDENLDLLQEFAKIWGEKR